MGVAVKPPRLALALALLCTLSPAGAQETDNRAIFYVMLMALESTFVAYNGRVQDTFEGRIEALTRAYRDRLRALDDERAAQDTTWKEKRRGHDRHRAGLDAATAALNERIRNLHERWEEHEGLSAEHGAARATEARLDAIDAALAREVASIRELWRRYQSQVSALDVSQRELTALTEDYRAGRHPVAQEVRRLSEEFRAFTEARIDALDAEAAAHAQRREAFRRWRSERERELARLGETAREGASRYRMAKSTHDRVRDALAALIVRHNALVVALNDAQVPDDQRESVVAQATALERQISSGRMQVEKAREEATTLLQSANAQRSALDRQRDRVEEEAASAEQMLLAEQARIDGKNEQLRSGLAVQRRAVQARVRTLEEQMAHELRTLRAERDERARQVDAEFGDAFPELYHATAAWLADEQSRARYESDGSTPRFAPASPALRELYAALERIEAWRDEASRIVDTIRSSGRAVVVSSDALTRENEALGRERARLAQAYEGLATAEQRTREAVRAARAAWNERRRALVCARVSALEVLESIYEARLALTGEEFESLQAILLASIRDEPVAYTPARDPAALHAELVRATTGADFDLEPHLLERNALLATVLAATASRAEPASDTTWASYRGQPIVGRRVLGEDAKRPLTRRWFELLSPRPPLVRLRDRIRAHLSDVDSSQVEGFLSALFETGMLTHARLLEVQFDDHTVGVQAVILDFPYWIEASGYLEKVPEV